MKFEIVFPIKYFHKNIYMNYLMLYYNRIDVSEGIAVNLMNLITNLL